MAKKKYPCWELDEKKKCRRCKKKLKKRLVESNLEWELCYRCHKAEKITNHEANDKEYQKMLRSK